MARFFVAAAGGVSAARLYCVDDTVIKVAQHDIQRLGKWGGR